MKRFIMLVSVLALAATSALAAPMPYSQLAVAPRQLDASTAHMAREIGMWEYIYDVYGNGSGWFVNCDWTGFDGTQIVNQFGPLDYGGRTGTLVQKWDQRAARNPPSWDRYVYGSYSTDIVNWQLTADPQAIMNIWHTPSEYKYAGSSFKTPQMLYPGTADATGAHFAAKVMSGGILNGLIFTVRIVHPLGPVADAVTFHSYSYNDPFNVYQTLMGPGAAPAMPGDFDGDDDVDADDIDLLCDNLGDPDYDLDGDDDADEDDMVYLIENLVELIDARVGTKRGDFNLDGLIDATDLAIMGPNFGLSGMGYADGNANCDDLVNATDLAILSGDFGYIAPAGAVPEPVTIGLLSVGGLALLRRRK